MEQQLFRPAGIAPDGTALVPSSRNRRRLELPVIHEGDEIHARDVIHGDDELEARDVIRHAT